MIKIKFVFISLVFLFSGCHKISNDLQVILKNDSICAYSDQKYDNSSDNYFVVFVYKLNYLNEHQNVYEKVYKQENYPLSEDSCVKIPLSVFAEKNKGYSILLDIGRTPDVADICIVERKG